jgi:hypothetical protein
MFENYTHIQLRLGDHSSYASILNDHLPKLGSTLRIGEKCWEVIEARYGFKLWNGVEGMVSCAPCA